MPDLAKAKTEVAVDDIEHTRGRYPSRGERQHNSETSVDLPKQFLSTMQGQEQRTLRPLPPSDEFPLGNLIDRAKEIYFRTQTGGFYCLTRDDKGGFACFSAVAGTRRFVSRAELDSGEVLRVGGRPVIAGYGINLITKIYWTGEPHTDIKAEFVKMYNESRAANTLSLNDATLSGLLPWSP